jgi:5-epimerase
MDARELEVVGAYEFTPVTFADDRGSFASTFEESVFVKTVGHWLFPVAQASCSVSRRGVVRGVHYLVTPPGVAKYVSCPQGRALDIVVDVRVGSPTFGRCDSVVLDQESCRAVYFPVGVGHAFVALEDGTVMSYLLSREYVAEYELALSPVDPALGLPIPTHLEPILSDRDLIAPTMAQALAAGLLPAYDSCLAIEAAVGRPDVPGTRG